MFFYILMLFIGGAFILQIFLGQLQIKHFSHVFTQLKKKGKVAVGRKTGRLKSGTIVMLALDTHGIIMDARKMQGVTILAHFHPMNNLIGENIESISPHKLQDYNKLLRLAVRNAVDNYTTITRGGTIEENKQPTLTTVFLKTKTMLLTKLKR